MSDAAEGVASSDDFVLLTLPHGCGGVLGEE
jgi:hypothetical protein